ncbi:hypothetical protein CK374_23985, partial [Salmonella enterica subsp. enterica serovar Typhi]|nr:hypothetical protein [Salmonella enterica subsp. enterica serovar Typhi]
MLQPRLYTFYECYFFWLIKKVKLMKLSVTLAFFGYMMVSSMAQASDINMWREPKPVVKEGKYYSLIMDRGELQKAVKSSSNNYLFSEKGAGVK